MITENIENIIPQGQTKEDVKIRRKIIMDFYAQWNASNPAKRVYNVEYNKAGLGKLKLTVGVLRGSKLNIQYCITAIEKTITQPARTRNS